MRKSRLRKAKWGRFVEHFVVGTTARCASGLVDISFETATCYCHRLLMLFYLAMENKIVLAGEIEVGESYFGGHRKGERGRGAAIQGSC